MYDPSTRSSIFARSVTFKELTQPATTSSSAFDLAPHFDDADFDAPPTEYPQYAAYEPPPRPFFDLQAASSSGGGFPAYVQVPQAPPASQIQVPVQALAPPTPAPTATASADPVVDFSEQQDVEVEQDDEPEFDTQNVDIHPDVPDQLDDEPELAALPEPEIQPEEETLPEPAVEERRYPTRSRPARDSWNTRPYEPEDFRLPRSARLCEAFSTSTAHPAEPRTYREAITGPDKAH